jgi:hypothetical protein
MKYIISESQHRRLIESVTSETIKKVSTNWFKKQISRGEDPHIDGSLLMFLGSKPFDSTFVYIMESIENFLGPETAYKVGLKRSKKTFDTNNYPDITGGYSFKFNLDLEEFDETQFLFNVNVLPGAEVTLVMTDDTTHKIEDIIKHEDIGWEIKSEMDDIIDEIMIREICFYTGFFTTINKVELT